MIIFEILGAACNAQLLAGVVGMVMAEFAYFLARTGLGPKALLI